MILRTREYEWREQTRHGTHTHTHTDVHTHGQYAILSLAGSQNLCQTIIKMLKLYCELFLMINVILSLRVCHVMFEMT